MHEFYYCSSTLPIEYDLNNRRGGAARPSVVYMETWKGAHDVPTPETELEHPTSLVIFGT